MSLSDEDQYFFDTYLLVLGAVGDKDGAITLARLLEVGHSWFTLYLLRDMVHCTVKRHYPDVDLGDVDAVMTRYMWILSERRDSAKDA